jgi:hypothetical protein
MWGEELSKGYIAYMTRVKNGGASVAVASDGKDEARAKMPFHLDQGGTKSTKANPKHDASALALSKTLKR